MKLIIDTDPGTDDAVAILIALAHFTDDELFRALSDRDQYIRAWAVQMLAEDKYVSDKVLKEFIRKAEKDKSPVVRLYLSSAMQRIDHDDRWDLAAALLGNSQDNEDHNIPLMIWFAVEPLVEHNPDRSIVLAKKSNIPLVAEYIARRLVDAQKLNFLVAG